MTTSAVWLITGCSSGFGLELARAVLARGHQVIASSRTPAKTPELVEEVKSKGGSWISLDVTADDVKAKIAEATAIHGRIDVLVNNAGTGINAGFEDLSDADFQALFSTNVLGTIKATQAVLPYMRARRAGTIINISSTSGLRGLASMSAYAASKFALEGISESLAAEYAEFGIRVILVEPGMFRTAFLGDKTGVSRPMSAFYEGTATEKMLQFLDNSDGKQPGDPVKAAEQICDFATEQGLAKGLGKYLRLPLGNSAIKGALGKAEGLRDNFEAVAHIARSCDY
ncbi:putative short chain oxidoreductase/dehydrogenase [Thozetella sp. PMI_491]|nr:putative short chain oxidoreductase/dehydrogenase [Thozetella sp. PMI_491]